MELMMRVASKSSAISTGLLKIIVHGSMAPFHQRADLYVRCP